MKIDFKDLGQANLILNAIYKGGENKNPMKDDPLSKIFIVEGFNRGIGNQGGFRKTSKEKDGKKVNGTIAFVVIVDSGKQAEWPNKLDRDKSIFTYYGDNRTVGNDIFNTKNLGNKFLYDIFTKSYAGANERAEIPPIFIFQSTGSGCDKEFIGLAVPGVKGKNLNESLERKIFKVNNGEFENYIANFTILDIKDKSIDREWLKSLKDANSNISYVQPEEWTRFILNGIDYESNGNDNELEIREDYYPTYENEVERTIKVRVTQGKFRDSLLQRDCRCILCGLDIEALLVASHIKPWSDSNDFEKIDSNNGVLLCANHDALFDKGFISFDSQGNITISRKILKDKFNKLNISSDNKIVFTNKNQQEYMNYHRNNIFIDR